MAVLKKDGYIAAIVEVWNPWSKTRKDLLGLFDVIAIRADVKGVTGIQVTSASNHAARRKKMLANPILPVWLAAGNLAVVASWRKVKGRWISRSEFVQA